MNERRGNQATGLALQDADGEIHVFKQDEPAWKVTSSDAYQEFLKAHLHEDTKIFLGHTRLATQGDPKNANNNHPLYHGGVAVVHNGHISNDDWMFKDMKLDRKGEVDSDIIRAILDENGFTEKGINQLSRLCGSAAIAAMSAKEPGRLLLGRSGNPLVLAATDSLLAFSSEKQAIHSALRPFVWRFGFTFQANKVDFGFLTMPNDQAYILGEIKRDEKTNFENALEWHQKLNIGSYYNANQVRDYSHTRENYGKMRKRWNYDDSKKPRVKMAWCTKCQNFIEISPKHLDLPRDKVQCAKCKTPLDKNWLDKEARAL